MPSPSSAIVIVIDGLRASALGTYGNTTFETPALNRLAAESVVFDWAFTDSVELPQAVQSQWSRWARSNSLEDDSLATAWKGIGENTVLLTDEPALMDSPAIDGFDEVITVPATEPSASGDLAETAFAQFFTALLAQTLSLSPGTLLWAHCRGLHGPWDAPQEFRQQLAGPEDPPPPEFVLPLPTRVPETEEASDLILGWQLAYAGQLIALDQMLELFLDQATEVLDQTWLGLTATRGYPLGEHGWLGGFHGPPHAELAQVPFMIRQPECREAGQRSQRLIRSAQMGPLLNELCRPTGDRPADWKPIFGSPLREAVLTNGPDGDALRTHAWSLVGRPDKWKLYARPDDRGEFNDVSGRCPDVVAEMAKWLDQINTWTGASEFPTELVLPDLVATRPG